MIALARHLDTGDADVMRVPLVSASAADLLGAVSATAYMALMIGLFLARLAERPDVERWLGLVSLLVVVPIAVLFVVGLHSQRPLVYFVWLGLFLAWEVAELLLDYVLNVNFRHVRWAVIPYVMFFFAATGGLLGLATQAGKPWLYAALVLYFSMAALAFVQRAKTGL